MERCIAQLVELAVHDLWLGHQAMDPGLNPARGHLFHPLSLPVLSLSLQWRHWLPKKKGNVSNIFVWLVKKTQYTLFLFELAHTKKAACLPTVTGIIMIFFVWTCYSFRNAEHMFLKCFFVQVTFCLRFAVVCLYYFNRFFKYRNSIILNTHLYSHMNTYT